MTVSPLLSRKVRVVQPYPITYTFKVKSGFEGRTLLELMQSRFPFHGARVWEEKIRRGNVGINGEQAQPDTPLQRMDEVYHHNPKVIEPSVPDEVKIIQETPEFLIVFKPAPMPMHPGGRFNRNSLTSILENQGYKDLRIVHRLDSVTSGLVLFARSKRFAQQAMEEFRDNRVHKTYYALVSGVPDEEEVTIQTPIRRKNGFVFESGPGLDNAKEATTTFERLVDLKDKAVVRCRPLTGRTHQIRLHLEHWGFPIIDDPIYGIDGDKSSRSAQKTGISLINAGLKIDSLNVHHTLEVPQNWVNAGC